MKLQSIISILYIMGSFGKSDFTSTEQPQLFLTSNITRKLRVPRSHMTIPPTQFTYENLQDTLTDPYEEETLSKFIPYLMNQNEKQDLMAADSKIIDTVIMPELNDFSAYWNPFRSTNEMRSIPLYWITRGRREAEEEWENMKKGIIREPLYVDEPSWILVAKGEKNLSERDLESTRRDPFWVSRGRRQDPTIKNSLPNEKLFWESRGRRNMKDKLTDKDEHFWVSRGKRGNLKLPSDETFWVARGKRGLTNVLSLEDPFWVSRGKRNYISVFPLQDEFWGSKGKRENINQLLSEDPFWISRGKRGNLNTLSGEDPFWVTRGKRGNLNSLSGEDPFWVTRGKRGNLNTLSGEDPFWVARGKKNEENNQVYSNGKKKRQATRPQARGLGKPGPGDPFWVSRGKREDYDYYDEDAVQ